MNRSRLILQLALVCLPISVAAASTSAGQSIDGSHLAQADTGSLLSAVEWKTYGPVVKYETLWDISKIYKTDSNTVSQIALGIYRNNPQAFQGNNINRLKINSVLKIPGAEIIQQTNYEHAYKEVIGHIKIYERYIARVQRDSITLPDMNTESEGESMVFASVTVNAETIVQDQTAMQPDINISNIELDQLNLTKEALQEEIQIAQSSTSSAVPGKKKAKTKPKPKRPLFRYSYDVSTMFDDNIRKAQDSNDIREDVVTSFALKARGGLPIDSFTLINYGAEISYDLFNDFDTLNSLNYNINARYRFALSSGFTSPIYSFSVKLGGIDSDQIMRDSSVLTLAFNLNKWLTNTINMTVGIDAKIRDSKSEVFDLNENRLFVNFDLNLNKTDLIYSTYTFITGDTVSSASPSLTIINAADAIEPDDAFGGITTNQFAYRLNADTQVLTVGYNKIMSRSISIDLSARLVSTEAADGIGYDRTILGASLLGRF